MGGIGKTELSKQYALNSPYLFTQTVTWKENEPALFETLLQRVNYDSSFEIRFYKAMQIDKAMAFKLYANALSDVDEKYILIIDNVNELTASFLRTVYEKLNCKIIITTRKKLNLSIPGVEEIEVTNLPYDELLQIFTHTYGALSETEHLIYKRLIYEPFYGNTQAIVMVSKMLSEQGISLKDYAAHEDEYLKNNLYSHEIHGEEVFDTVANNLSKFFKISNFMENDCIEREILSIMTIVEQIGIDEKYIKSKYKLKNSNVLLALYKMGLLNRTNIGDSEFVLSMHPMIAKALELNGIIPSAETCKELAKYYSETLGEDTIHRDQSIERLNNMKQIFSKMQLMLPSDENPPQTEKAEQVPSSDDGDEFDLVDILLDENNTSPIVLVDQNGKKLTFDQIAVIPLDDKLYCILKPLDKIDSVAEDEAIVFYVDMPDDGEPRIFVELDNNKRIQVFEQYYALLFGLIAGDDK